MEIEKTYNKFEKMFKDQLGLELKEILTIEDGKLNLSGEMLGLSMASLRLTMTREEHGEFVEFTKQIEKDNSRCQS